MVKALNGSLPLMGSVIMLHLRLVLVDLYLAAAVVWLLDL